MSEAGSVPGPVTRARARSATAATSGSASPTTTTALMAMHRSPAEPYPAAIRASAVAPRSASGSTTAWFLAPPSAWTRLPEAWPRSKTWRATGVEPTKETAATSGWSRRASTASASPWTTVKTPSGRPASRHRSATRPVGEGSRSEGLSTKALPQAMATGYIHMGTITGKLNGVMPATTPRGWRTDEASTPVETSSLNSPFSRWGMPQANSTTSMPRATSPRASSRTLPCSAVTAAARSSRWRSHSSRKAKRIRLRAVSDVSRHASAAAAAPVTAASTSAREARTTSADWRPVAGSKTGAVRAWASPVVPIWFTVQRSSGSGAPLLGRVRDDSGTTRPGTAAVP